MINNTYIDNNNQEQTPLCIHRAPLGTHERFIGFLIEHYAGNFPLWLMPVQMVIIPISDKFNDYAQSIYSKLKENNIKLECTIDDESNSYKWISDPYLKSIIKNLPF